MFKSGKKDALRLLRRGAPASGKNYLTEKTLLFIPDDAVARLSSGSPLSLVSYGADDEDALRRKVLYIPEGAILAERKDVPENPLAVLWRQLISEGRLDHNLVIPQASGPPRRLTSGAMTRSLSF